MKVVINRCFGGFALSIKAEREYARRKGFEVHHYIQTKFRHEEGEEKYSKVEDDSEDHFCVFCLKTDLGQSPNNEQLNSAEWLHASDIERNDPELVSTVEELGEAANGSCAELAVIEIPDGVEFEVEEYDGLESVHELHRSWS